MYTQTVNYITNFFKRIDSALGVAVPFQYCIREKGKFPLFRSNEKLAIVPAFFNHPELSNDIRSVLMAELYSCFYLDRNKDGHLEINPGYMSKGICNVLGIPFFSDDEIEENLRTVRRKLFDDTENGCYFDVGQTLRESPFVKYEVTGILRSGNAETLVTVKPIVRLHEKNEKVMTEEDLYARCCVYSNLKDQKVDMRKNLFVISGPSGVGKDTVIKALLKKHPNIRKTISVTTRAKRSNETDGVDYYFITEEKFSNHRHNGRLVEYELYDGAYYGTLYSEIERHSEEYPLILVIDVRGRRNVLRKYPMARSIFITPPSPDDLKSRIITRNKNTLEEMEHRLAVAEDEFAQASLYDHVVVNDDVDSCVEDIFKLITVQEQS